MRRDHRPHWMRRASFSFERWWTRRFLAPQFDRLGIAPLVTAPWCVEVFGAGIEAGDHLHILAGPDHRVRFTTWPAPEQAARIQIGDGVLVSGGARVLAAQSITIGDAVMLARDATVTDCDWHGAYDRVTAVVDPKPVHIADNAWVGDGAFVGKGVRIGENAIVGARAVVTKDVPANTVVAGNPAKMVKELDPDAPRRTRLALFENPRQTAAFMEEAWLRENRANTFVNWLRTVIAPSRLD